MLRLRNGYPVLFAIAALVGPAMPVLASPPMDKGERAAVIGQPAAVEVSPAP